MADRTKEAQGWFNYLAATYPNKPIIENQIDSLPATLTLDQYAVAVVQIDIGETSQQRVTSAIMGLLTRAYYDLAIGEEDRYQNLERLAERVHRNYVNKTYKYAGGENRIGLAPFEDMKKAVVRNLLDPQYGMTYEDRAALVTRLGLKASALTQGQGSTEINSAPSALETPSTNSPAATNAVAPAQP